MSSKEMTVGILGGMGPEATVDLMRRIIKATPANDDADHIRLLVDNDPKTPSRIQYLIENKGKSPAPHMVKMALGLEGGGADILVIPCNTAHMFYGEVSQAVSVPVLNILELSAEKIHRLYPDFKRVGILGSSALQITQLYAPAFAAWGVDTVFPDNDRQEALMALIRAVKANTHTKEMTDAFNLAAEDLEDQGAACLLIACTELSVIAGKLKTGLPKLDASQILAEHIVERVKG
ncbi:amino acid racemase [Enterovibrio sp. ZSDZ42]|uniref:Amino acid racemase n=1 Tax=Enterovibrio gelatinilyticus TaxID=2899819 RepID=A0ABT5QZ94_9GAMM|nr:amino acid racemase [Enterovibrio sp. ZSDZ42]MDD1793343.1 amino acid racemase [Enterovibrio sp. ZSDZ42]